MIDRQLVEAKHPGIPGSPGPARLQRP
jgi:hypothetical protein